MENNYTYLKLIQSQNLTFWDVKSYNQQDIASQYKVEKLQNLLIEHTKKVKLFEKPEDDYKILGVNNQEGLFDAYIEKGKNINQPYKKVENGYFAYNPYRINVGSIGLKSDKQKYDYISPAYVVFSCQENLHPQYLEILLKTSYFAQAIRHNTTGSVRQTLGFDNLCNISIPLPSVEKQKELVRKYEETLKIAIQKAEESDKLEKSIDDYIFSKLFIKKIKDSQNDNLLFKTVVYNKLKSWDIKNISNIQTFLQSSIYDNYSMTDVLSINPKTLIPANIKISFIPMEYIDEIHGEVQKMDEKNSSESKGYTKFMNNDIIWAKITPCMQNGKSALVGDLQNEYGCGSTEFYVIRNDKRPNLIRCKYIYYLLRLKTVLLMAQRTFTGACGQQRVPVSFLSELQIPLPPLKVQDEIIHYLDENKNKIKSLRLEEESFKQQALYNFEQEVLN